MAALIERILPFWVSAADVRGDLPGRLWPEEEADVAQAVDGRRAEYLSARICARRALDRLGIRGAALPKRPGGDVRWPDGVVGSLTHCTGYRAAAVARRRTALAVGIDAEPDRPLPDQVAEAVASLHELRVLDRLPRTARAPNWDRLLFTAKEAVVKVWYPVTRWAPPFGDIEVTVAMSPRSTGWGHFRAQVRAPSTPPGLRRLHGRWLRQEGFLLSAVAVPAPDGEHRPEPVVTDP